MLVSTELDVEGRIFRARYAGTFKADDILDVRQRLAEQPDVHEVVAHLADLTEVRSVSIDAAVLARLAEASPYGTGSRVAIVASRDLVFGLARLFEVWSEGGGSETRVFRDMDDACAWLGVEPR